jgi:GNAT superfamily N-acetyltransferase
VPAKAADAPDLAELRVEAMQESLERIGRFDPGRARSRFLATFSAEATRHIVVAGDRVGFVVIRAEPDHLLLDHLYVRPASQGAGIGAAVLLRLFGETDASSAPIRVGALKGSASNRFYLRHGFELVDRAEWDNYYLRPPAAPE